MGGVAWILAAIRASIVKGDATRGAADRVALHRVSALVAEDEPSQCVA